MDNQSDVFGMFILKFSPFHYLVEISTSYVMASIYQYKYWDFRYEFLSILFEWSGQSISILFAEQVLICTLDSIG